MPRTYLPLLPLPVLAAVVAFSACGSGGEPSTRVIPAAVALAPAPPPAAPPAAPAVTPAPRPPTGDDAPSAEELRAFARPVPK